MTTFRVMERKPSDRIVEALGDPGAAGGGHPQMHLMTNGCRIFHQPGISASPFLDPAPEMPIVMVEQAHGMMLVTDF